MKLLFLILSLLSFSAYGDVNNVTCTPASACTEVGPDEGCQINPGSPTICDVTATDETTNTDSCVRIYNYRGDYVFVPAKPGTPDWRMFKSINDMMASFSVQNAGACGTGTVRCEAAAVSWNSSGNTCYANAPGPRNYGTVENLTDSDNGDSMTGSGSFSCYNGVWQFSSGSCVRSCAATTASWSNCSAPLAAGAHGATNNSSDPNTGTPDPWTGSANYYCDNGNWQLQGGWSCDGTPCGAQPMSWGGSCSNSVGVTAHGGQPTITNTAANYTGTARYDCANSLWSGPFDATCVNNCPAGQSSTGAGQATPTAGCFCANAGETWCATLQICEIDCPGGTSPGGGGAVASGSCRCNNGGELWNGSYCFSCPGGTSPGGNGGFVSADCKCNTAGQYWNGSSCVTSPPPPSCTPDGSIRTNPTSGLPEKCLSGGWIPRNMTNWCTPPADVHADDDGDAFFHQTYFLAQNATCEPPQRSGGDKSSVSGGRVHGDDGDRPCSNTMNCRQHDTPPVFNGSCPAITIGWAVGGNDCYDSAPATPSNGSIGLFDPNTDYNGHASAYCLAGMWIVTPGRCDAGTYYNCETYNGTYGVEATCAAGGLYSSSCAPCDYTVAGCRGVDPACE